MDLYFDRAGRPIPDAMTWSDLRMDRATVNVARAYLPGGVTVSTVWLGISVGFFEPPLIFETVVIGGKYNHASWRYPSEVTALAGHDQIVAALRAGEAP